MFGKSDKKFSFQSQVESSQPEPPPALKVAPQVKEKWVMEPGSWVQTRKGWRKKNLKTESSDKTSRKSSDIERNPSEGSTDTVILESSVDLGLVKLKYIDSSSQDITDTFKDKSQSPERNRKLSCGGLKLVDYDDSSEVSQEEPIIENDIKEESIEKQYTPETKMKKRVRKKSSSKSRSGFEKTKCGSSMKRFLETSSS